MNDESTTVKKHRVARHALVAAAVAGALAFPLLSQNLRTQDEPAPATAAEPDDAAAPAADEPQADEPKDDAPQADATDADAAEPKADAAAPAAGKPKVGATAAAVAAAGSKVIASAGDLQVTADELATFFNSLPQQEQVRLGSDPQSKQRLTEHLLKMKTLARAAEAKELDQDPQLKLHLDTARLQILAQAMASSLQDEAADKAYYESHKDQFGEVQVRHILIATKNLENDPKKKVLTEEQAKKKADDIRAERLEKGEDFAKLAMAESDDSGSREKGGEYTFGREVMVPAFEKTAWGLELNEISQPVKTDYGYHVIQLLKRIPASFEKSRGDVNRRRLEDKIKELMGAEPTYDETFFGKAPAADAAAPADAPAEAPAAARKPAAAKPAPAGKGAKGAK